MGYREPTDIGIVSIADLANGVMLARLKNFHAVGEISAVLIDSTILRTCYLRRVLQKNGAQAAEALGHSHGGFTTKLNAAVSDMFLPLRFILTAGARHGVFQAPALIAGYACECVIPDLLMIQIHSEPKFSLKAGLL